MRVLICCLAVLSAALFGSVPTSVAQATRPLLDAVQHFQSVWSVDLSYASNTLRDRYTIWTEPVATTADADIKYLLNGTGVTFFRQSSGTFFLQPLDTQVSTITGSIHSAESGRPLRGAHIVIVGTSEGTISNLDGQFILSTSPRNSVRIRFSHVGYLSEDREIKLPADSVQSLGIHLNEWVLEGLPLQVTATPLPSQLPFMISDRPFEMDTRRPDDLRQITGVGTPDVVRSLRDVAGLYIDLTTSDIHIQGSGIGEHQFRLDGNVVFEPVHLGLFGIFNPFAIEQITVRKAGFNVEYGSYLAGIINAEHSLNSERAVEVQVDPISFNARITTEMDLQEVNLSLMGAFRTSIWNNWWSNFRSASVDEVLLDWNRPDEFLIRASIYPLKRAFERGYYTLVDRLQKAPVPSLPNINFNDVHTATKISLNNGNELGGSLYTGNSKFEGRLLSAPRDTSRRSIPPDRHIWENHNLRLYWQQNISDSFIWRISWHKGEYSFSHNYGGLDRQNSVHAAFNLFRYNSVETSDQNGISHDDVGISITKNHAQGILQAGVDFSWIDHNFSIQHIFPRRLEHERTSFLLSGYLQHEWIPRPWVELTSGFLVTRLRMQDRWHIEPRTALLFKSPYRGGYGISLRLATGVYYQFLNQFEIATISPSSIVPSTRFWIPVDETLQAPLSNHYSIDLSAQLWTNWQLGVEYYYKDQRRLYRVDYPMLWSQERDSTIINTIDQFVSETSGLVYGTSLELRRNGEKLNFALRYERSESKREFTFRNNEPTIIAVPWNVPQQFQVKLTLKPIPALEGILRWHGAWGRKWAFKQAYYDLLGSDIEYAASFDDYSFENPTADDHTLAPFSQLDLGIIMRLSDRSNRTFQLRLDLLSFGCLFDAASFDDYSFENPTADDHTLAPFSQLDLGIIMRLSDRSNRTFQLRLDLLNAYDRKNPAYHYLQERNQFGTDDQILVDKTSYLIGRTLTVSAQLQW